MAANVNDYAKIGDLGLLANLTGQKLATTFKSLAVSGNTVSFFTSTDGTGTAAATFDFPEEIFLDQAGTTLVENFTWSAATYPNTTNPNLDGKTVLVLGVKGDKETNPTTKYSFVNLEKLIDTYTAADNSIDISGYTVAVKISATAGNSLTLESDGLYVDALPKITSPTAGNIPQIQSDGTLANSTVPLADVLQKVANPTQGHVAIINSDGTIADSGYGVASDEDVAAYLAAEFATGESGGN